MQSLFFIFNLILPYSKLSYFLFSLSSFSLFQIPTNYKKSISDNFSLSKNKFYLKLLCYRSCLLIFYFLYDTFIIKQSSSFFMLEKIPDKLDFVSSLYQVNHSNIFLLFYLYIWPSKVNCIFIIFVISFSLSKLKYQLAPFLYLHFPSSYRFLFY